MGEGEIAVKISEERMDLVRFGFVAAMAMWALCTFSVFAEYMKTGELFAVNKDGKPYVSDFSVYYAAGQLARQATHTPTNVYDLGVQDAALKKLIYPVAPESPFYIQYPPPFFVIASILPFFTLSGAWIFWVVVGDIAFYCALYYLLRDDLKNRKDFVVLSIAIAASLPFWVCNRLGQAALLTVPVAILFWALVKNSKMIEAGLSCALLLIKFQYLPFLGLVGAARGKFKFVIASIIASAISMFGSGLMLGMPNVLNYPQTVLAGEYKVGATTGVNPSEQQNLRSLLVRLTGEDSAIINKICIISCLVVAFIVFAFWLKALKNVEPLKRFKFLGTLTICCLLFFSPHAHKQDYLMLAIPCSWIWLECIRADFAGAKWMKSFVVALPFISWAMFILDQIHPPIPPFALLLPLITWASYETFCRTTLLAQAENS